MQKHDRSHIKISIPTQNYNDRPIRGKGSLTSFARGIIAGSVLAAAGLQFWENSTFYPENKRLGDNISALVSDLPDGQDLRVSRAIEMFSETAALVEQMHLKHELDSDTLSKMLDGALGTLDKYSGFISEELAVGLTSQDDPDHRRQIGFIVSSHDGAYRIESVAPGSPAEIAGIRPGDEVMRIDGRYVGNETAYTVNEILRQAVEGQGGDTVDLGIQRPGMKTMLNVTVKPADIDPVTVFDLGVTDGVLHLYLKKFYPGLASDTEALIARAVQKQGIKGVVLDLRNNGGGLTDEALKIADLFLPKGTLLYEMAGRAEGVKQVRTDAIPRYATLGLSIITNGNSASASEIIAGAFQAHNRATIVGWKSLGKGTVQRVFPVESGAITITFAEYRDGGLRKINGVGVMPDVLMDAPDPRMRPSRFDKDTARDSAIVYALKKHEDLSTNSKFNVDVDVDEKP